MPSAKDGPKVLLTVEEMARLAALLARLKGLPRRHPMRRRPGETLPRFVHWLAFLGVEQAEQELRTLGV